MYEDQREWRHRLAGGYVLWKNNYVYVDAVRYLEKGRVFLSILLDNGSTTYTKLISCRDPHLNILKGELGYFNRNGGAQYITRSPRKQWKQSFRESVLPAKRGLLPYSNAKEKAVASYSCIAFHKDWAVSPESIFYKGQWVGSIEGGLSKKYLFLRPLLNSTDYSN